MRNAERILQKMLALADSVDQTETNVYRASLQAKMYFDVIKGAAIVDTIDRLNSQKVPSILQQEVNPNVQQ